MLNDLLSDTNRLYFFIMLGGFVLILFYLGFLLGSRHGSKGREALIAQLAHTQTQLQLSQHSDETMKQSFSLLSGEALDKANEKLFHIADQSLIKPVNASIDKLQARLAELEKSREGAYGSLTQQVQNMQKAQQKLQTETVKLVQALKTPTGRGQWGEMQLKRVLEMSGMTEYCHFLTQVSSSNLNQQNIRPDAIIKLPGGKHLIIDAKTPMDAYLASLEAPDDNARREHLLRHAKSLRSHLDLLGKKQYETHDMGSPDFVILFLPSEALFQAALEVDPQLIEVGAGKNVILSTPTTLIALLRAVAYGWKQEALTANTLEIAKIGSELLHRCCTLSEHFDKLGANLQKTVQTFNSCVGSFDSQVLSSAKKLKNLGVSSNKMLIETPVITEQTRLSSSGA